MDGSLTADAGARGRKRGKEALSDWAAATVVKDRTDLRGSQSEAPDIEDLDAPIVFWPMAEGYVSLGQSALRHWAVMAIAIVLGALFGVGGGEVLAPTYTARAALVVGKTLDLTNTAAISGFPLAEMQLAQDYSRLSDTPSFDADVVKHLGHQVSGTVTASPEAQSPVINVYASAKTEADAVALANAGSAALVETVNSINQQSTTQNSAFLDQYAADARIMEQDQETVSSLQVQVAAAAKSGAPNLAALEDQLVTRSAVVDTDRLKLSTLSNQYQAAYDPNRPIVEALTPLGGSTSQGSDRRTHIEIGLIAGLVGGAVLGLALAASQDVIAGRRVNRARPSLPEA